MATQLSSEESVKYCILIIGDTGSGKSSTGNTILGNLIFPVAKGLKTGTRKAKAHTVGNITVIDTPTITPEMTDEDANVESREWLKEAGLKPNAIVLTINCKNRFTPEEYILYCRYKRLFRNIIESKLLVIFTRGDLITPEETFNPCEVDNLKRIINDAGERYFIYNNKTKDYAKENKKLLEELKAISKKNEKEKGEYLQECDKRILSIEGGPTQSDMSTPRKSRRVLLMIGKSGTGKSSTGNTILGSRRFEASRGFKTQTLKAEINFNDEFEIIDTPDIPLNMSQKQAEVEVESWFEKSSAIPNAVLLTINADEEYSNEDVEIFKRLKDLLERRNVCENLIIVFTRGDLIDRFDIEQSLIHDKRNPIRVVLEAACGRYVIFDNKTKDSHKKIEQLKTLSEKLELPRQLPKRRSLKEREQSPDSALTHPISTSRSTEIAIVSCSQKPACQCTPSVINHEGFKEPIRSPSSIVNVVSATSSSSEDEIRVLIMGAQPEARDKLYASLRKRKCDRNDWYGHTEAGSRIFKVIKSTLLLDGLVTSECENGYQQILLCSNLAPHVVLFVAAVDEHFNEDNYKAIDCFVNTFSKHINNYLIIVLFCSEPSDGSDQTRIRARINEKLKYTSPYLRILKATKGAFLPFNFTNKPDDMNNQVDNAFQWILSLVATNKGRCFDNNEALKLNKNLKKNMFETNATESSYQELSSPQIPQKKPSEPKQAQDKTCHIF